RPPDRLARHQFRVTADEKAHVTATSGACASAPRPGASASAPGRELLEGPGVAVEVGEEHELAPRLHIDVAGLDPAFHELLAGGIDVADHDLHALLRARRHLGDTGTHHDRARRSWRGELHESQALIHLMVMVSVKAHLIDVKGLGPVDIAH